MDPIATVLAVLPEFGPALEQYRSDWVETPSLCADFTALTQFVTDRIEGGQTDGLEALFACLEPLVAGGGEVGDAVATCFLENLLNVTPQRIPARVWIPLLGPASRKFCRAWDQFTGVKTEGLWDD